MKMTIILFILATTIGLAGAVYIMTGGQLQTLILPQETEGLEGIQQPAAIINDGIERGLTWTKECNGNICTLINHILPINYYENDVWTPINQTLVNSDDREYDWMVEKGVYTVYFKENIADERPIKYEHHKPLDQLTNITVYITPYALVWRNGEQVQLINFVQDVEGYPVNHIFPTEIKFNRTDTIFYPNIFGYDTNLTLGYENHRLVKRLYVNPYNLPAYLLDAHGLTLDLLFKFEFSTASISVDGNAWNGADIVETTNDLDFIVNDVNLIFFEQPYVRDKFSWVGNESGQTTQLLRYEIEDRGGDKYLSIRTPASFLFNRSYNLPFEIDPSIQVDLTDSGDDAESGGVNCNTFDNTSAYYYVGNSAKPLGCDKHPTGWIFDSVNVPAGANITNAYIRFRAWLGGSGSKIVNFFGVLDQDLTTWVNNSYEPKDAALTGNYTNYNTNQQSSPNGATGALDIDFTNQTLEIVNNAGWDSGDSMGFVTEDNGTAGRTTYLQLYTTDSIYDDPYLYIEWVVEDTCTYSSGDWEVECSDNCNITDATDLMGNNLILNGTGTFRINADITNFTEVIKDLTCEIIKHEGNRLG